METLKIVIGKSKGVAEETRKLFKELGYYVSKKLHDNCYGWIISVCEGEYTNDIEYFNKHQEKLVTVEQLRDLVVLKRNDVGDRNVIDPEYIDANLYLDSDSNLFVFHIPTQKWKESNLNGEEDVLQRLKPIEKEMKEYLDKDFVLRQVKQTGGNNHVPSEWIEVPKGMNFAYKDEFNISFTKLEMGYRDSVIIWQRHTQPEELTFIDDETKINTPMSEAERLFKREQCLGNAKNKGLLGARDIKPVTVDLSEIREVFIGEPKSLNDMSIIKSKHAGRSKRENNHYFIDVSDVDEIDFYEIAKRYNVTDPAIQHILKKCLAVGGRGHKDMETDLKDIFKTAKRALEINNVDMGI